MKIAFWMACASLAAVSSVSFAAPDVCKTMMTCASYEEGPDQEGMLLDVNVIATDKPDVVKFEWIYINTKDGKQTGGIKLDVKFEDDGRFAATSNGQTFASGVCKDMACTYGIMPVVNKEGTLVLQTGTFKFTDTTLELSMWAPNLKDGDFSSKGVLNKKN
jgi:hypothetical protein